MAKILIVEDEQPILTQDCAITWSLKVTRWIPQITGPTASAK